MESLQEIRYIKRIHFRIYLVFGYGFNMNLKNYYQIILVLIVGKKYG